MAARFIDFHMLTFEFWVIYRTVFSPVLAKLNCCLLSPGLRLAGCGSVLSRGLRERSHLRGIATKQFHAAAPKKCPRLTLCQTERGCEGV
jgi:hypothetical protein